MCTEMFEYSFVPQVSIALLVLLLSLWLVGLYTSPLPRGPTPLPILGNLVTFVMKDINRMHLNLMDMGKYYGDVFTVYFGSQPWVILNGNDVIKEAFSKYGSAFSGRPSNFITDEISKKMGIVFADGNFWQEQRSFAVNTLRDFGVGKMAIQTKIQEEITCMLSVLRDKQGQAFNIKGILTCCMANVISNVLYSKRYHFEDEEIVSIMQKMHFNANVLSSDGLAIDLFPILRYIPNPQAKKMKQAKENLEYVCDVIQRYIDEHNSNLDPENIRDFTDAYLVHMKQVKSTGEKTTFTEFQLKQVIRDFLVAGMETSATTLSWGLLYLMTHPKVQRKARKELNDVIGDVRMLSYEDRERLPYMEAVCTEIHRLACVSPLGLAHMTTGDMVFRGYRIPSGTTVVANLASTCLDEKLFPNPMEFKPERHLDVNGRLVKPQGIFTFSVGRRMCPGDTLARMEIFLFLSAMIQNFTFRFPVEDMVPDINSCILGVTRSPHAYRLCAEPTDED